MPPTLRRVVRLDSIPIRKAVFTDEGYLRDKPILTSTGIFEYTNPDGSIRRELRLPEDVFAKESLASYKGKPIIITHDAGLVTKDNVHDNQVGTILSEGFQDGENVRADIVIHDTDEMKDRGYKELSLGYNLDLEETPGTWHGQPYDAIQRNIIINHLALVREARAGEQARLNIDSRDSDILKGGKSMNKTPKKTVRGDGILSKEELEQAIKEYKARRAKEADKDEPVASEPKPEPAPDKTPEKKPESKEEVKPTEKEKPTFDEDVEAVETVEKKPESVEDKIQQVKENRNMRDEEGDPKDKLSAMGMIAHQDEDIDTLFDIIDTLLAEREFKMKEDCAKTDSDDDAIPDRDKKGESVSNCDGEEVEEEEVEVKEEPEGDPEDDEDWEDEDWEEDSDEEEEDFEVEEDFEEDSDDSTVFEEEEEDWEEDEEDEWEEEEEEVQCDSHDSVIPDSTGEVHHVKKLNSDSVDAVINQRIALGMLGRKLNMDGLEKLGIMSAKKRIIKAVRPNIRLDGKSDAYINAAYDCAVDEIQKRSRKGVKYQKKQMFNKDSKVRAEEGGKSSADARREMIERQINRNK